MTINLTSILFILILLIATAACSRKNENVSESRSEGARLFARSCQTCHALPKPSMKGDDEWPALVARYGARANLNESQISAITAYLISNN
jgi:mono/diheme cytochrome c family protein